MTGSNAIPGQYHTTCIYGAGVTNNIADIEAMPLSKGLPIISEKLMRYCYSEKHHSRMKKPLYLEYARTVGVLKHFLRELKGCGYSGVQLENLFLQFRFKCPSFPQLKHFKLLS